MGRGPGREWRHLACAALLALATFLPAGAVETLTPEQLRPGDRGIGRTVFRGATVDSFDVEILGVLRRWRPQRDLVLARLAGGPLEETGVIAGMSGSPVYVDGKLIGAIAYGWSFPKQPIAGITPIGEMLDVMDGVDATPSPQRFGAALDPLEHGTALGAPTSRAAEGLAQVAVPLACAGFDRETLSAFADDFSTLGFVPIEAGAGTGGGLAMPLVPGAPVGVQLIGGDMRAVATGTVTHVEEDRLIAFGHPMFGSGATDFPLVSAEIIDVFPSYIRSFKFSAAGPVVGAFRQDRPSAIAGVLGAAPHTIPMIVTVHAPTGEHTYELEMIDDRRWTPLFVRVALFQAIANVTRFVGDATLRVRTTMELAERPPVSVEATYATGFAPSLVAAKAAEPVDLLARNRFEAVGFRGLRFDISVAETLEAGAIQSVALQRTRVHPGDAVDASVVVARVRGEPASYDVALRVPAQLGPGPLMFRVGDATAAETWEQLRAPGRFSPESLDDLIALISRQRRQDVLVAELVAVERSITFGAAELPSLPPSVVAILRGTRTLGRAQTVRGSVVDRHEIPTSLVLSGTHETIVDVVERGFR